MPDEVSREGGRTVSAIYEKATIFLAGLLISAIGTLAAVSHDSITRTEVEGVRKELYEAMDKRDRDLSDRLARMEQSQAQTARDVSGIAGRLGVTASPVTPPPR